MSVARKSSRRRPARTRRILASLLALAALAGCGQSGPPIASVQGTVTLDGKPLPDATVTFQPDTGRPSFGATDENGRYAMEFNVDRPGVLLGHNKVFIRTRKEDDNGKLVQKEFLPPRYHDRSELEAVVEQKANVIDFQLTSK